jgi:hypothetical protein
MYTVALEAASTQIEGRYPEEIAADLRAAYADHC